MGDFVSKIERLCGSQTSIARLRHSEAYTNLFTHWSLPVYFQIRFQNLAATMETAYINPTSKSSTSDSELRFNVSAVMWDCI